MAGPARDLMAVLAAHGISWDSLLAKAEEIVLFGSHAASVADAMSDWDLLCIGDGTEVESKQLGLLWRSPAEIYSDDWLQSELAAHIRDYGKWLHGRPGWTQAVRVGERACARKQRVVLARSRAGLSVWRKLSERMRARYRIRIQRDIQRLAWLRRGLGPPPRALLDAAWHERPEIDVWWSEAGLADSAPPPFWLNAGGAIMVRSVAAERV